MDKRINCAKIIFVYGFLMLGMGPGLALAQHSAESGLEYNKVVDGLDVLSCLAQPYRVTDLGASSPGVIKRLLVERGDRVEKGQLLVKMDDAVIKATLQLRKAQAAYLGRVVNRNSQLYKEELLPSKTYDEMTSKLKQARLQVAKQKSILGKASIQSPFDGVVVETYAGPGERINDNKILKLAQLDPLLLRIVLPARQYGQLKPDDTAHVEFAHDLGAGTGVAKVWRIDRVVDAASGTFAVWLEMKNPHQKIPAGLRCTVSF